MLDRIDLARWAASPPKPREFTAVDLLPVGAVSSLYGDGGTGKTMLALDLIVAQGLAWTGEHGAQTWAGRPLKDGCASVAVVAEDSAEEIVRRLAALAGARGATLDDLTPTADLHRPREGQPLFRRDGSDLTDTPGWRALWERVEEQGAGLLILDPLAALYTGDEMSRDQVQAFLGALNRASERLKVATLLLAHPSQEGLRAGRPSGSTGWWNHTRQLLTLEAGARAKGDPAEVRRTVLTLRKNNYGPVGNVTHLAFDGRSFSTVDTGAPERGPSLTMAQRLCLNALRAALADHGEADPAGVRAVRVEHWRTSAYAAGVSTSEKEASRRRAFFDTRNALVDKGLVIVADPFARPA